MATLADFKHKATAGAEIRGGYFWKLGLDKTSIDECEWRTIDNGAPHGKQIAEYEIR